MNKGFFDYVLTTRRKSFGDRALLKAGPTLWDLVPYEIRLSPSLDSFIRQSLSHQCIEMRTLILLVFKKILVAVKSSVNNVGKFLN